MNLTARVTFTFVICASLCAACQQSSTPTPGDNTPTGQSIQQDETPSLDTPKIHLLRQRNFLKVLVLRILRNMLFMLRLLKTNSVAVISSRF